MAVTIQLKNSVADRLGTTLVHLIPAPLDQKTQITWGGAGNPAPGAAVQVIIPANASRYSIRGSGGAGTLYLKGAPADVGVSIASGPNAASPVVDNGFSSFGLSENLVQDGTRFFYLVASVAQNVTIEWE